MNYTLYQLLWFFLFYSFIGWAIGTSVAAVREHRFIDVGFLFGPYCPACGFGAVAFAVFLPELKNHLFSFSRRRYPFHLLSHFPLVSFWKKGFPSKMVGLFTEKISVWWLCQPSIHCRMGSFRRSMYLIGESRTEGTAHSYPFQPGHYTVDHPVHDPLSGSDRHCDCYQSRSFPAEKTLHH